MQEPTESFKKSEKPNIFQYLDFRKFLKDAYDWKKQNHKGYSQRTFISDAGLPESCSSLLPAIINGRRNLSQNQRVKFGLALGLKEKNYDYWDTLVQFNQAKGMVEKNFFFEQLQKFHRSKARIISQTQMRFYSKWYYNAIWNYFGLYPNQNHPGVIAASLFPKISIPQVKEAIDLLLELNLIRRTANGYRVEEMHLSTENDVKSLVARQYIEELTKMSLEMLSQVPSTNRQYNALMFGVNETGFLAIKDRIRSFQEELREIIDQNKDGDRIYTLTMQLFPNSTFPTHDDKEAPGKSGSPHLTKSV